MRKPLMTIGIEEEIKPKDKCVICDCETQFDIDEHLDFRLGYIEGCGLLWLNCYE